MRILKLKECSIVRGGYAFKSDDYKSSGIPLIRISNINGEKIEINDKTVYIQKNINNNYSEYNIKYGDILIALSGATTGKFGIYTLENEALLNQRVALIRTVPDVLFNRFLYYFLFGIRQHVFNKAQGVAQPNISTKELEELKVSLPPLPEQKRIAEILDKADDLRKKRKETFRLLDEYLKSVYYEMFGDPVKNEKGWDLCNLNDICNEIQTGFAYGQYNNQEGLIHVRPFNINNLGYLDLTQIKYVPKECIKSKKYFLEKGNIIINTTNSLDLVGKTAIFTLVDKCCFSNHITKLSVIDLTVNPYYLWFTLNRYWKGNKFSVFIKNWVNQVEIDSELLKGMKLPVPPILLQNQFAQIVEHVERTKSRMQESLKEMDNLFNSLMQRAFKKEQSYH